MLDQRSILKPSFHTSSYGDITPIRDVDLPALQYLLDQHSSSDPYQKSAGYFAMTGRSGLWWAKDGDSAVIICRHPNTANELLVFPPIGPNGERLLTKALAALSAFQENVRLARFEGKARDIAGAFKLAKIDEDVLDWTYPVHVMDTLSVSQLRSRKFQSVRTNINKLDTKKVNVEDFDPVRHRKAVLETVQEWEVKDSGKLGPYARLVDIFDKVPMAGRVVFYDGKPAGFSLWEETDKKAGMANAFAHLALHDIPGLSQFVFVDMCRTLVARGFKRVCIGGSETEGLDYFKRRFRPVDSVELHSYELGYDCNRLCQQTFTASSLGAPSI